MARISLTDYLQNFCFTLLDVAPISATALPVFLPGSSFSSISSPELQLEMQDIPEGNTLFTKRVVKRASVSPITLQRGATVYDSDFYKWIMATLYGNVRRNAGRFARAIGGPTVRRTLMLLHFYRHSPLPTAANAALTATAVGVTSGVLNSGMQQVSGVGGAIGVGAATAGLGLLNAAVQAGIDAVTGAPPSVAVRLPARAWLLHGCLPTRYKAGSDFDATSGDVSIMELEIQPESFTEISLGRLY